MKILVCEFWKKKKTLLWQGLKEVCVGYYDRKSFPTGGAASTDAQRCGEKLERVISLWKTLQRDDIKVDVENPYNIFSARSERNFSPVQSHPKMGKSRSSQSLYKPTTFVL
jgi:hypothetical protein